MIPRKTLTHNEKLVFFTLVKKPHLNDRQISEDTGIKLSTVTAIRRRLQANGHYQTVRVPNMQKLGFELLVVGYGPLSIKDRGSSAQKLVEQALTSPKEIFLSAHSSDTAFFLAATKNYTSAKRMIESLQHILSDHDVAETWHFAFFPFEISSILNFFNCSNIMETTFHMGDKTKSLGLEFSPNKKEKLTLKEKKVMKALVQFPDSPDNLIAQKSGASRQGVSAMRKRFEASGLLHTLRMPDFQLLGYEIFVIAHTLFNPKMTIGERGEGINYVIEKVPQMFIASGNFENILMAASRNYEEYTALKNDLLGLYRKHDFIRKEPQITLIPLSEMRFMKNHDYGDLLKSHWK